MLKTLLTTLLLGGLILMSTTANAKDLENTIYLQIENSGTVEIELLPSVAPKHVEQIKTLTRQGFYDGIIFHRVIDGFMAQTGDPTGTGTGGSDLPNLKAEFSDTNYGRGTVGMARSSSPDSANSQFFICFDDCSFLNGQYTVFGQVTEGMAFIDAVEKGEPPANPSKIAKMIVAADFKAEPTAEATPEATPADAAPAEATQDETTKAAE